MNWNYGFSASYYITIVDPITWQDVETINITGGSVKRSQSGLRSSASLNCIDFDQTKERWVRVYLDAQQSEGAEHVALFTGLSASPTKKINGQLVSNQVECYSVLKPCEDVLLPRGWYAPAGATGTTVLKGLLEPTFAPVVMDSNSPKLTEAIIAEKSENNLTMIDKVLNAMDWRLKVTGDGVIHIEKKATKPIAMFDPLKNDSIEPEIDVTYDWYSCPNVFRATSGNESQVARDETMSPLSVKNRGREIWKEETSCKLNTGETLTDYAKRRLKEVQMVELKANYSRRFNPDIYVTDLLRLHYPEQELDGVFFITSQSIDLSHGARTTEEVVLYEY